MEARQNHHGLQKPTKRTVAPHPAIAQSLSLTPSTRFLLLCSKSTFLEPLAPIFNHNNTTLSRPPASEIFESRSTSLYVLLLDWHAALNSALLRYGAPPHCTSAIMALYSNGLFFVSEPTNQPPTFSLRGVPDNAAHLAHASSSLFSLPVLQISTPLLKLFSITSVGLTPPTILSQI